jgi:hypothetical protein
MRLHTLILFAALLSSCSTESNKVTSLYIGKDNCSVTGSLQLTGDTTPRTLTANTCWVSVYDDGAKGTVTQGITFSDSATGVDSTGTFLGRARTYAMNLVVDNRYSDSTDSALPIPSGVNRVSLYYWYSDDPSSSTPEVDLNGMLTFRYSGDQNDPSTPQDIKLTLGASYAEASATSGRPYVYDVTGNLNSVAKEVPALVGSIPGSGSCDTSACSGVSAECSTSASAQGPCYCAAACACAACGSSCQATNHQYAVSVGYQCPW